MGLFDRKEKSKADFSNVQSGSSSVPDATGAPAGQAAQGGKYTVKKGDTLSAIAQREYGDANAWRRIYDANRDQLDNPDVIHPGQELSLPAKDGGAS
jgi:nucleoid-associated protein YgaU